MFESSLKNQIIGFMIGLFLLFPFRAMAAPAALLLDRENIFSLYFKMSGEAILFQDVEDLYSALGKPTFSNYKPTELFMKNSLKRLRQRLIERKENIHINSIFAWHSVYDSRKAASQGTGLLLGGQNNGLPEATPYISSDLSEKDRRAVNQTMGSLIRKTSALKKSKVLFVTLYLIAEKTERRIEKRLIALEDVFLPIRRIIFRPVGLAISPDENLSGGIAFHPMGKASYQDG